MYLVNPDPASKMIHYIPETDGRCHIDNISNPIKFKKLQNIDQKEYPNKCKICMK